MATSISSSLVTCRNSFNALTKAMQIFGKEKKHEGLSIPDWEDERGRLRVWAANIGAHQTGQSSLDFRLRDSSQIQQQIIRLLENLIRHLEDARTVLREGEDSDVESINGSESGDEEPQSELQQLRSNVASLIKCLFEISVLIRKPARHDVRIRSKDIDLAAYEWVDLRHVKDKFPKADDEIVSRLGHAITYRRKYLKYRERHAAKLRQGIDHDVKRDGRSEMLSETIATDVKNTMSFDDVVDDNASDTGFTQTSYASTLISGSRITIPTAPEASRGGAPFECPYCYCIVTAPNSRTWSRHVFNDLEPYVCTDKDCKTPNKLYATRHEWLHHMKTAHRQHENETHICALCEERQRDQASLGRHVARHLQELALFILPRNEADSDEDISDAKADTSSNRSSLDHGQDLPLTITPDDATHALPEQEKDYPIKCICGFHDDDGNTVFCDRCKTWQHTECYYFENGEVLDVSNIDHLCANCKPRQLDVRGAIDRQCMRRQQPDLGEHKTKKTTTTKSQGIDPASPAANAENFQYDSSRLQPSENSQDASFSEQENENVASAPECIRVHRKHIDPETLNAFNLPWEWDDRDQEYMIINRWISEDDHEKLFLHTENLRERQRLREQSEATTEVREAHGLEFEERLAPSEPGPIRRVWAKWNVRMLQEQSEAMLKETKEADEAVQDRSAQEWRNIEDKRALRKAKRNSWHTDELEGYIKMIASEDEDAEAQLRNRYLAHGYTPENYDELKEKWRVPTDPQTEESGLSNEEPGTLRRGVRPLHNLTSADDPRYLFVGSQPSTFNPVSTKGDDVGDEITSPDKENRENHNLASPQISTSLKAPSHQAKAEGDNKHEISEAQTSDTSDIPFDLHRNADAQTRTDEIPVPEQLSTVFDASRPTYLKVHRKHLEPATLDAYELPWEWDDRDSDYLIIKRWLPEIDQDLLFEHTRKYREQRRQRLVDPNENLELAKGNSAQDEQKKSGNGRVEKGETEKAPAARTQGKEKWIPVPYVPSVQFSTPIPTSIATDYSKAEAAEWDPGT
ncbi:MAG: hypothetical protein Q9226_002363 [Calogaya cf. arnoldii]